MARDRIPTSRVRRTATLGRLAAGQAVRQAGTRAANVARSRADAQAALERRHLEAAEQIVTALGTMKGAAMKLGQVLSFLDVGLVPEEHREEFQAKLAALRDAAPKVAFKDMRKVIEQELGDDLSELFAAFDEEPIAAASIGQVYRARLHDGRDAAVKVQYPGVAAAVRADMQNLGLIMRVAKRMTPGLDVKAVTEEIRLRIDEELDYELEAQNQRSLARIFRGHPFIHVPDVVTRLSRERVIVSEFVEGVGFEKLKTYPQADRDRLGEIVFRFFFGCLCRHHQFSGDPHPGNFLLEPDGRVAFLDFGLFKRMAAEDVESEMAVGRAVTEGDAEEVHVLMARNGFLPNSDRISPEELLAYMEDTVGWYTTDGELQITPELATRVAIESSDPRSRHFRTVRHQDAPPEHLFTMRMLLLTVAVLGQLRARANWHRIAREWMYGDPAVTELGRLEEEFYGRVAA